MRYISDQMAIPKREQNALIVAHLGIVVTILGKLRIPRGQQWQEARAEGQYHLARAATTFDPGMGSFATWAWWKVNGGLKSWLRRETRAAKAGLSFVNMGDGSDVPEQTWDGPCPDEAAFDAQVVSMIRESLEDSSAAVKKLVARMVMVGLTRAECTKMAKTRANVTGRLLLEAREELEWLRDSLSDRDDASR